LGDNLTHDLNASKPRRKRRHVRTKSALSPVSKLHLSEALAPIEEFERRRNSASMAVGQADDTLHELARSLPKSPYLPAILEFVLLGRFRFSRVGQKSDG